MQRPLLLTAWNDHFPSGQEQLLWRIAACIVMGGGLVVWGSMLGMTYNSIRYQQGPERSWEFVPSLVFYCSVVT